MTTIHVVSVTGELRIEYIPEVSYTEYSHRKEPWIKRPTDREWPLVLTFMGRVLDGELASYKIVKPCVAKKRYSEYYQ